MTTENKPKRLSFLFYLDIFATVYWFLVAVTATTMGGRIVSILLMIIVFLGMLIEWGKVYGNTT